MKNRTAIINNISLNFVPHQNESKIRHIAYQDLVNTVHSSSSKRRRSMTVNFRGKIHNHDHITYKDVSISWKIHMFGINSLLWKRQRVNFRTNLNVVIFNIQCHYEISWIILIPNILLCWTNFHPGTRYCKCKIIHVLVF